MGWACSAPRSTAPNSSPTRPPGSPSKKPPKSKSSSPTRANRRRAASRSRSRSQAAGRSTKRSAASNRKKNRPWSSRWCPRPTAPPTSTTRSARVPARKSPPTTKPPTRSNSNRRAGARAKGAMKVAYLGPAGTFTEDALREAAGEAEFEPLRTATVPDAILAGERGEAEGALVPFENSIEGSVRSTLDTLAFEAEGVTIVGEHDNTDPAHPRDGGRHG